MAAKKATTKKVEKPVEEPKVESEMIEVSKEDLSNFLDRLNTLEADNKKLLSVADKARLHQIDEKERMSKKLIREVTLSRYGADGPIIVAWKMTKNESRVDAGRMIEDQRINIIFEDGDSKEISLKDFYKALDKSTVAEITSRVKDEKTGKETLKVEMRDGKQLEIGLEFVN